MAFYDALEVNDSDVKVLGDENLRIIARELVETVRRNVTIDWAVKETARAKLRVMVRRILRKHGYPPDKQEKATQTVCAIISHSPDSSLNLSSDSELHGEETSGPWWLRWWHSTRGATS